MRREIGCNRIDHQLSRRGFVAGSAAGAVAVGTLCKHIAIMERRGLEKERAKGGVEVENS